MLETNQIFRDMIAGTQKMSMLGSDEIELLHQALLFVMDDIDQVCRKHGLTYFLCGGSALGAVRHGGFIPWDDDIDVAMPRKDYDRLGSLLEKEFPGKYWIQDARTDAGYDLSSIKVRKQGTRFMELLDPDPEHAGIFIDIYPLEDTFHNGLLRLMHGCLGEFLLLICSCVRMKGKAERVLPYLEDAAAVRVVEKKVMIGRIFSFISLNRWLRITEKILSVCVNPDSKWISIPSGRKHYFGEMYTRASFYPPKEIDFEGRRYFIMNEPTEHLRKLYGEDYMMPPEDGHKEKHAVLEFSLDS